MAMREMQKLLDWCRDKVVLVETYNHGQHIKFLAGTVLVEWWPSTGKLVQDQRWRKSKRVHSPAGVIRELQRRLPPPEVQQAYVRPAYLDRLDELLA